MIVIKYVHIINNCMGKITCNSLKEGDIGTVGNVSAELEEEDGGKEPSFGPYITPPSSDPLKIFGE